MNKFPRSALTKMKYYVYLYIDPRDNSIFYVGKGQKNRAFAHLNSKKEQRKALKIKEIRAAGDEPKIEVLVHGLANEKTALRVEASIIDLIGIDNLTNIKKGYGSRDYGRMSIDQLAATYASPFVEVTDPAILIKINTSFRYGITPIELYDATRSAWRIGTRRAAAKYALAVYEGVVQEVYEILGWYAADSTFNSRTLGVPGHVRRPERMEFVGRIAAPSIRKRYLMKNVSKQIGPRYPVTYVKC